MMNHCSQEKGIPTDSAKRKRALTHRNLLATALANKLARIAWAVLARGRDYEPEVHADAA